MLGDGQQIPEQGTSNTSNTGVTWPSTWFLCVYKPPLWETLLRSFADADGVSSVPVEHLLHRQRYVVWTRHEGYGKMGMCKIFAIDGDVTFAAKPASSKISILSLHIIMLPFVL